MMWASLLLAGFLSGWWGALALAAAPPANRNSLGETSTRGTRHRVPSEPSMTGEVEDIRRNHIISPTVALPPPFLTLGTREINGINDVNLPTSTVDRLKNLAITENQGLSYRHDFDRSNPLWPLSRESSSSNHFVTTYQVTPASFESIQKSMIDPFENRFEEAGSEEDVINEDDSEEDEKVADLIRDAFLTSSRRTDDPPPLPPIDRNFHRYPKMEESSLTRAPRHSSSRIAVFPYPFGTTESPSVVERPRAIRSATVGGNQRKQNRPKNRTRADSPREQRRRCKNKGGCRGQNWCPDVDVGNRAYLAPTVFEGKARSMSSRKSGANYAVTFEVKQVYKSQPGFQPLQKNDSVRLHFRDKSAPGKSTVCDGNNNGNSSSKQQRDNQSGVVRANIKRGKVYLVFVNRVGPRNFTILGEPVIRSKKNEQAVQAVVRPDYVREVTLSELRDSIARLRDRVKLVCRTRGSPPPRVHWLKDGMPLYPRRGLRIQHKRRRSKVVISSAKLEDSGRYECVAESTSGHRASLAAKLLVAHDIPETTTAAWPRQEQPCPIAGDFCMNGGTCLFFETVGEPACRCAEGFTGQRCETKDVISTGSVYNRTPFSCKLGLSTSYYC